jgi:hypothetical protein
LVAWFGWWVAWRVWWVACGWKRAEGGGRDGGSAEAPESLYTY